MPEQNWGYVVLLNSTNSGRQLRHLNLLAIDFLSRDFPKPQQSVINSPAGDLEKFAGFYAPRAPRTQMFAFLDYFARGTPIRVIKGQVTRSRLFRPPDPLLGAGHQAFR